MDRARHLLIVLLGIPIVSVPAQEQAAPVAPVAPAYDPLVVPDREPPAALLLTVHDAERKRDLPVRIFLPEQKQPAPVVLFSHGLGGNREGSTFLGKHFALRGYAVVYIQHPGSDDSVWKNARPLQRMAAMQGAASGQNLLLRCQDVTAVLDALARFQSEEDHPCEGRLDLSRVCMSGHSFGAMTTQVVSGQALPLFGQRLLDARIDAAIVLSPSSPRQQVASNVFQNVKVPWMLMTGTKDTSPIGDQDVASRLRVYPSLPEQVDRFELLLHDAEHSVFTDGRLLKRKRPEHHSAILALSTAFLDTYVRQDQAARAWLQGAGPASVLAPEDRFQRGAAVPAGSSESSGSSKRQERPAQNVPEVR